jgi:hypothetical protein
MKPDILTKLAAELADPINSERQVVYVLVELRKLIELNADGPHYPSLKFHCDWAAHAVLKGPPAQEIVRLFDRHQEVYDSPSATHDHPDMSFMARLGPILTMSTFRNELNSYLHAQGLDSSIPNDNDKWAAFLSYYVRVIEDCPLKCTSQGLQYVDEVVLNVLKLLPTRALANGFQLAIEWRWKSKITGRVFTNQQLY